MSEQERRDASFGIAQAWPPGAKRIAGKTFKHKTEKEIREIEKTLQDSALRGDVVISLDGLL